MLCLRMHPSRSWPNAIRSFLGAFAVLVSVGTTLAQRAELPAELAARIDRLIVELDDDSFEVREKAMASLVEIGPAALAKVTAAAKDSSTERSQRAASALKSIRQAMTGLKFVSDARHDTLMGAVTLTLSPDGKFAYVPGFQANTINVFRRDTASGALALQQALTDREQLGAVVTVRLTSDGKQAIAAAIRSKSVALLSRNATTGELTVEAVRKHEPEGELDMELPYEAIFSPDDKFAYAFNDHKATVIVFQVEGGKKLNYVQTFEGVDGCFNGARGIVPHPDNKTLYVCSYRANTLSVLDRDPMTGKLGIRQILRDEEGDIHGLAGVIDACISRDGKHLYTAAGRWEGGDNAIGVYLVGMDGKLILLQEFINDKGDLVDFVGGGKGLAISPDGKFLYVSAVRSGSLACFQRDPATGKLTFLATLHNETTGTGLALGAHGVDVSPDGKFLYLALEYGRAVSVFERTVLTPKP